MFVAKQNEGHIKAFSKLHLTTHTFRRGFAQFKFFHEDPSKRWSLKMLKWWGGWSDREGCDVIMKYLLDSCYNVEDEILADAMAPDREEFNRGCPTKYFLNESIIHLLIIHV